ncbi:selenium metabolism-associated LysR family transcriptional regulator [Mediterraneibacter sp. ICN-202921]|uniref:selenium metabolism-associated LysR family transcriptional regulator n=1 Tax=Mediterraneibacter sp. ICN-202921 TaxID=3134657 RepID=UPI0030C2F5BA
MNLKQLEAFVKVARERNFSKAAKDLFLTQPTVSAHIASLEKELNVRLFVRNTKGVELSEDGEKLFSYAQQMVELEKQIEAEFDKSRKESSSLIKIAASTVPAQYLLPEVLACFGRSYPHIQLKVMETDSIRVIEQVAENRVDIGFTGTMTEKRECVYLPFYEDELVLIVPNKEKYRVYARQEQGLEWIKQENLLLREEGSGTRTEAEKKLKKMGLKKQDLHIKASIGNTETIKRLVSGGAGISILSKLAVKDKVDTQEVLSIPLEGQEGKRSIHLVYNKQFKLSKPARDLIHTVQAIYCGAEQHKAEVL